jgi:hypothetical protein
MPTVEDMKSEAKETGHKNRRANSSGKLREHGQEERVEADRIVFRQDQSFSHRVCWAEPPLEAMARPWHKPVGGL